jgi:hypothetical protein
MDNAGSSDCLTTSAPAVLAFFTVGSISEKSMPNETEEWIAQTWNQVL